MKLKSLAPLILVTTILGNGVFSALSYACDKAQMVDYDYQVQETLGNGYSTFGRMWLLDNKEQCVSSLRYPACLTVKPLENGAEVNIKLNKGDHNSSVYTLQIEYNSTEFITFNYASLNVYLKLYVSNTIADVKMAGRSCDSGFPSIPRQVTKQELDNMYKGI